jgi:hypothetical protein
MFGGGLDRTHACRLADNREWAMSSEIEDPRRLNRGSRTQRIEKTHIVMPFSWVDLEIVREND